MGWNRVRWVALNDLTERRHISVYDIDGGFEFNGLYMYDPDYQYDLRKSWWWVRGDMYKIGFGSIAGYTIIE